MAHISAVTHVLASQTNRVPQQMHESVDECLLPFHELLPQCFAAGGFTQKQSGQQLEQSEMLTLCKVLHRPQWLVDKPVSSNPTMGRIKFLTHTLAAVIISTDPYNRA